jgi:anti-anti-sigma factor
MWIKIGDQLPRRVTASGEIDFGNSSELRETLEHLIQDGKRSIELDLSGVDFIDSSGIGVLVDCAKTMQRHGGVMTLVLCSDTVRNILCGCGLADIFGMTADRTNQPIILSEPGHRWLISSFSVPVNLKSPAVIRGRLDQLISDLGLSESESADVRLAVGEAATNAVKYCGDVTGGRISVRCTADSRQLTIEITDPGPGFDRNAVKPPDFHALPSGGMGIAIMELVMDEVRFEFHSGTTVWMMKRLHV